MVREIEEKEMKLDLVKEQMEKHESLYLATALERTDDYSKPDPKNGEPEDPSHPKQPEEPVEEDNFMIEDARGVLAGAERDISEFTQMQNEEEESHAREQERILRNN
mmetsp:Transcript_11933/g.18417  ORF Transcript_11933/g.18417 Transcript_11933/m.18417 type:complete len:107 (-) Transcript_11933:315-635(-)